MRKNNNLVILYLILANVSYGQVDTGVHFIQGLNWGQIKEKAKVENKYIFVDCYASWCGPCKAMDKQVYLKENVGKVMNQHFISLKAQMDTSKQDDDRIKQFYTDAHFLMQEYKINEFPYLLFFSPEGKLVHKAAGFRFAESFISMVRDAMDTTKQYCTLIEKFKEHNLLDTGCMKLLARNANLLGDKELARKIANYYIDQLNEDGLYQSDNVRFMIDFTASSRDRGFAILKDHSDKICQADSTITKEGVTAFIEDIIYKEEMKPYVSNNDGKLDWTKMKMNIKKYGGLGEETFKIYKPRILFKTEIEPALKNDPDWNKAFALIKKQNAGKGEEFLVGSSIVYYLNNGLGSKNSTDCKNFMGAATLYFKKYYSYLSANPLNDWAWSLFEKSTDKNELNTALVWSDSCLKKSPAPDPYYYDTYANLLYKLGRNQEAISWEEKASNLAPQDKGIQDNFLKMKKGIPTWGNN